MYTPGGVGFFWGEGVLKCCGWKRGDGKNYRKQEGNANRFFIDATERLKITTQVKFLIF